MASVKSSHALRGHKRGETLLEHVVLFFSTLAVILVKEDNLEHVEQFSSSLALNLRNLRMSLR